MATNLTPGDDFFLDTSSFPFFQGSEINGRRGNDTILGQSGDDTLSGNEGNDQLFGQADDDSLFGDADNDVLFGGSGSDLMVGGTGNDALFGNDGNDRLRGDSGDDALVGGHGADTFFGGAGNDHLSDSADGGNDTLRGERGNDTFVWSVGDSDRFVERDEIDGGPDSDRVEVNGTGAGEQFDIVVSGDFTDLVVDFSGTLAGGLVRPNLVSRNIGELDVVGRGGDDVMRIDNGSETPLRTISFEGGEGTDLLQVTRDTAPSPLQQIAFDGGNGSDSFSASAARTPLLGLGGAGSDIFAGGAGNDEFHGGPDRDAALGGLGNDSLFGDEGNDRLSGAEGDDTLTGGDGADEFLYAVLTDPGAGNRDTISDFRSGDTIEIFGVATADVDITGDQVIDAQDSPVVSSVGGGLSIAFGENTLTVLGVGQLTAGVDILFAS